MALNCNKEIPGVTDYEGTVGVPAGQVLPLPHRAAARSAWRPRTPSCASGSWSRTPHCASTTSCTAMTMELQMLARACGKTNVHSLEPEDLCALTVEASAMAKVPLAGTDYIPGVTERQMLEELREMMASTTRSETCRAP